jgi:hypothetical protein
LRTYGLLPDRRRDLDNLSAIVENDFNHLTCENAMNAEHSSRGGVHWPKPIASQTLRARGMKSPDTPWSGIAKLRLMFQGITADAGSPEMLKARLKRTSMP